MSKKRQFLDFLAYIVKLIKLILILFLRLGKIKTVFFVFYLFIFTKINKNIMRRLTNYKETNFKKIILLNLKLMPIILILMFTVIKPPYTF